MSKHEMQSGQDAIKKEYQLPTETPPQKTPDQKIDIEPRDNAPSGENENIETVNYDAKDVTPKADSFVTYSLKGEESTPTSKPGLEEKQIGDYEIIEEIARGGMGIVYKAQQKTLGRIVAIKTILTGEQATQETVSRFYSEAKAAATLNHPGIVPIYEISQHNDQHYFSMGYIEGTSLADRIARGPLPPIEAASIAAKIADAIQYAHEKGVIHRDIKPANILLDVNGEPKLTDFGLARIKNQNSSITQTGAIIGTPSYMSPEQASGDSNKSGPLSDIYSIGGLLYCLLTGRPPFQAASPIDTIMQVVQREPISPTVINPTVPKDLETICLKCLQKKPSNRYDCAGELGKDLRRWLNGEPIRARAISSWERTWRWSKRNPILSGLLCSTVVGMLLALAFARHAGKMQVKAELSMKEAISASAESHMTLASLEARIGNTNRALLNLAKVDKEHRKKDWNLLSKSLNGGDLEVCLHTKDVKNLAISPDGTLVASSSGKEIWVTSLETSVRKQIVTPPDLDETSVLTFSPDQQFLVVGYNGSSINHYILIYSLLRSNVEKIKKINYTPKSIRFSVDGRRMLVCGYQALGIGTMKYGFEEREAVTAELIETHGDFTSEVTDAWFIGTGDSILATTSTYSKTLLNGEWSEDSMYTIKAMNNDGSRVARMSYSVSDWLNGKKVLEVIDQGSKQQISNITIPEKTQPLFLSPDRHSIIGLENNRRISRWNIKTGLLESDTISELSEITAIALCPEGRRIITGHLNGIVKVWLVDEIDSKKRCLSRSTDSLAGFSEDENQVFATGNSEIRSWESSGLFDASYSSGTVIVSGATDKNERLSFTIATHGTKALSHRTHYSLSDQDDSLDLWDLKNGKHEFCITQAKDINRINAISATGKTIAYISEGQSNELVIFDCERKTEKHRFNFKNYSESKSMDSSCSFNVLKFIDEDTVVFDANKYLFRYSFKNGIDDVVILKDSEARSCVDDICIDPYHRKIAVVYNDKQLKIFEIESSKEIAEMSVKEDMSSIDDLAWTSDGELLIIARENGTVELWDIYVGRLLYQWDIGQRRDRIELLVAPRSGRIFVSNGNGIFWLNPERAVSQPVMRLVDNYHETLVLGTRRIPPRDGSDVYFLSPIEFEDGRSRLLGNLKEDPSWHSSKLISDSLESELSRVYHKVWMLRASPDDSWMYDDLHLEYNRLSEAQKASVDSDFLMRSTLNFSRGNKPPSLDLFKSKYSGPLLKKILNEDTMQDELMAISLGLNDLKDESSSPTVSLMLAMVLLRLSEPKLAIDEIQSLLCGHPSIEEEKVSEFFLSYALLAIAHSRMLHKDVALEFFQKAETIARTNAKPSYLIQRIFFDAKRELFALSGLTEPISVEEFNKEGSMENISFTPWSSEGPEFGLDRYRFNRKITHEGFVALEVGSNASSAHSLTKKISVVPGQRYRFTGWFQARCPKGRFCDFESNKSIGLRIRVSSEEKSFVPFSSLSEWNAVDFGFIGQSDQESIDLEIQLDSNAIVFIDDLKIVPLQIDKELQ